MYFSTKFSVIPNGCFQSLFEKIKHFYFWALNESYKTGSLPISMRQLIIRCISKGNELGDNLKHCSHISLASAWYKFGSHIFASGIKKVLFSPNQFQPLKLDILMVDL